MLIMSGFTFAVAQEVTEPRGHIPEVRRYLRTLEIAQPVQAGPLRVYPVLTREAEEPPGKWMTLDEAVRAQVLQVSEKENPSVPEVLVRNISRHIYVLIVVGELISGGLQNRTVAKDTIVGPGQTVRLPVFCVEAQRWSGILDFDAREMIAHSTLRSHLHSGTSQFKVWEEVTAQLRVSHVDSPTASLDALFRAAPVRRRVEEARRAIVPEMPRESVGFIFVRRGRALGADFFGSNELALELLPKLLDSYVVDRATLEEDPRQEETSTQWKEHSPAIELFEEILIAGSRYTDTPGSGRGVRLITGTLAGSGVVLSPHFVHLGVQIRTVPEPRPAPRRGMIPWFERAED